MLATAPTMTCKVFVFYGFAMFVGNSANKYLLYAVAELMHYMRVYTCLGLLLLGL